MNEEKYTILDVSEPKTEEEREKVSNSRIATALVGGTTIAIGVAIAGCIELGANVALGNIIASVASGVQGLVGGFYAVNLARTTYDYVKENSIDEESEDKTL